MVRTPIAPDPTVGGHVPVLLAEVVAALSPVTGKTIVDGTFGAGGHARALLQAGAAICAIDRDPAAAAFAVPLKAQFPLTFQFVAGKFSQLDTLCATAADAVVLDIGVSSMQLDDPDRGFSFMRDGPLDMRMGNAGRTAAELVNTLSERELADLLFQLGEERRSRAVARAIVAAREKAPVATTLGLAQIVSSVVRRTPGGIHPATRAFQALRVAVNAEYGELVGGLFAAERLLGEGGTLCVVTFHSLEDRIVKRFFARQSGASRHRPARTETPSAWVEVFKPVRAGPAEIARNPRARSATLRTGLRGAAPARPVSAEGLGVPGIALGQGTAL